MTKVTRRKAEQKAKEVLEQYDIARPPVPVERLVQDIGARLKFEPFEGDVSGMLFRRGEEVVVGVNATHPLVRQRFTIAHELGHYFLHENQGDLFVDRSARVHWRDANSGTATQKQEIEANQFAAALLMPEDMIHVEAQKCAAFSEDELIATLAERFRVSDAAMRFRLQNLDLIVPVSF